MQRSRGVYARARSLTFHPLVQLFEPSSPFLSKPIERGGLSAAAQLPRLIGTRRVRGRCARARRVFTCLPPSLYLSRKVHGNNYRARQEAPAAGQSASCHAARPRRLLSYTRMCRVCVIYKARALRYVDSYIYNGAVKCTYAPFAHDLEFSWMNVSTKCCIY